MNNLSWSISISLEKLSEITTKFGSNTAYHQKKIH